ncbi:hypothetical protein HYH03_003919 [Edaphochlamys debaryana]|uniref:Uncharacterized protein n=1 Tax=Edaphochlamys debaryana TaxID=47281 RepID=A0A836C3V9_9CHLO|nr:hypothetical protein HYH03_003919 [Edaphochlamys debaryana]|eukprot:KAG2498162.1 hypothetical protein HYH03_003919 [Edaphochlamys debaryana]
MPSDQAEHLVRSRQHALETGELKDYPQVSVGKKEAGAKQQQQQAQKSFNPVPTETAADASGDVRTMRRRLAESLYLVVRGGAGAAAAGGGGSSGAGTGGWDFPAVAHKEGESISDTAQRALASAIGRAHPVLFIGAAPMAHLRAQPKGTTFFLLAQAIDDPWDVRLAAGAAASEFAWVTKQELLGSYLGDARMRELVAKML